MTPADRPLRIFHGIHDIGGNPSGLARAQRLLGHRVECTFLDSFPVGPGRYLGRAALLARLARDFDVVHLTFGQGILSTYIPPSGAPTWRQRLREGLLGLIDLRELALLRRCGTVVAMTYFGDDVRQGAYSLAHHPVSIAGEVGADYYHPRSDAWKRRRARAVAVAGSVVFATNPDLLPLLPARTHFLPYTNIVPDEVTAVGVSGAGPIRLAHAPTHRAAKGTRHLLDAVHALRRSGVELSLDIIEGVPRDTVMHRLAQADLVVDQLLAGWYGGLAVEAMALAKPVLAYIRPQDLVHVPAALRAALPIIAAAPAELPEVLRWAATAGRAELDRIGRAGRSFVERFHDPAAVARGVVDAYRGGAGLRAGR